MYASLLRISGALHLGIFEQPGKIEFFHNLLKAPGPGCESGPVRVFFGDGLHLRMVQGDQVTPIVYQLVSHPPRGGPEVTRYMQPIGVFGPGPRCTDVHVDVAGLRMFYHTTDERVVTLLRGNDGLRMDTRVDLREAIDGIPELRLH